MASSQTHLIYPFSTIRQTNTRKSRVPIKTSNPTISLTVQEARTCLLGAVQAQVLDGVRLPKVEGPILMELRLARPIGLDERHGCVCVCVCVVGASEWLSETSGWLGRDGREKGGGHAKQEGSQEKNVRRHVKQGKNLRANPCSKKSGVLDLYAVVSCLSALL